MNLTPKEKTKFKTWLNWEAEQTLILIQRFNDRNPKLVTELRSELRALRRVDYILGRDEIVAQLDKDQLPND